MNVQVQSHVDADAPTRKPRIVIAGEFSAGKSKLINGLLGKEILASNVTSTSLPPVWLVGRGTSSFMVNLAGEKQSISDLQEIDIANTLYCVISYDAPILEHFDLIDTPGNSDPNIPSACWERMIEYADGLVWCTGAMQAWRQSEKSACKDLPEELLQASTLLVTQADRMPDERAASKVLRRVTRDASSLFPEIKMGSLVRDEDVAEIREYLLAKAQNITLLGRDEPLVEAVRPVTPPSAQMPQPEPTVTETATQDVAEEPMPGVLSGPWDMSDDALAAAGVGLKLSEAIDVLSEVEETPDASGIGELEVPENEVETQADGPDADSTLDAESVEDSLESEQSEDEPDGAAELEAGADDLRGDTDQDLEDDDAEPMVAASVLDAEAASKDGVAATEAVVTEDAGVSESDVHVGEATAMWHEISRDADLSNAESVMDCVSTLLTRIDDLLNEYRGEAAQEAVDSQEDVKD